jgi:hypothetical protein
MGERAEMTALLAAPPPSKPNGADNRLINGILVVVGLFFFVSMMLCAFAKLVIPLISALFIKAKASTLPPAPNPSRCLMAKEREARY